LMSNRVVIAMSGGVDSSVAAALLKEQGYDCIGMFMRMGIPENSAETLAKSCCSLADSMDARRVADKLGIPLHIMNFAREFERLIDYFCREYARGRTPNPCIVCNKELKFGRLLYYADVLNAEFIATGHYTHTETRPNRVLLRKGLDPDKDQSYVLFSLSQEQLKRAIFPLGALTKDEVRAIAKKRGLKTHDKDESQDICFAAGRDYADIVESRLPQLLRGDGEFVDTSGNVVGRHEGIHRFTIGQRRGLGRAFGKPTYVVRIEPDTRRVVLGDEEDLLRTSMAVSSCNWIAFSEPPQSFQAEVKIRYASPAVRAEAVVVDPTTVRVEFERPVRAVTPGQAAVFYDGDIVLGGGWIDA